MTGIASLMFSGSLALYELVERESWFRTVLELRRRIQFTRAEAVNRERSVILCAVGESGRCERQWSGREVTVFMDGNRNRRPDPGEALRQISWPRERGQLTWRAALARRYLEFSPYGTTAQNGSFTLCYEDERRADVVVVVNRGGRSYVGEPGSRHC